MADPNYGPLAGGLGTLAPEDLAKAENYYRGIPGVNMSPVDAPPPAPAPPPPPAPAQFGPPASLAAPPAGAPAPGGAEGFLRSLNSYLSAPPAASQAPIDEASVARDVRAAIAAPGQSLVNAFSAPAAPKPMGPLPGPTAKDDAELAALVAKSKQPKPSAGGGGGRPANPDPYGVKADEKALLGTFDAESGAVGGVARAEQAKALAMGQGQQDLARRKLEDAAIANAEHEEKSRLFDAHIEETQRQLDDVRTRKLDPFRLMHDDGMGIMTVIGGVLGGAYMGLNHSDKNPFLEHLDSMIDRDFAAQRENQANEKEALQGRMKLLDVQRDKFRDEQLAKLQTRNLAYEATIQGLQGEAAQYDSPIIDQRAQQAIAGIERAKTGLKRDIDTRAQQLAQQQAGAAAAAARADMKAARERADKIYSDTFAHLTAAGATPQQAEHGARRNVEILMSPNGVPEEAAGAGGAKVDPVSAVPKDQRAKAQEEMEKYAQAQKGVEAIKSQFAKFRETGITSPRQLDAYRATIAGAYKAGLGPGMSSDEDGKKFIDPNIPNATDTDATIRVKEQNIVSSMLSKVATPTLDRHAPGWSGPAPVQHFGLDGKPK